MSTSFVCAGCVYPSHTLEPRQCLKETTRKFSFREKVSGATISREHFGHPGVTEAEMSFRYHGRWRPPPSLQIAPRSASLSELSPLFGHQSPAPPYPALGSAPPPRGGGYCADAPVVQSPCRLAGPPDHRALFLEQPGIRHPLLPSPGANLTATRKCR